MKGVLLRTGSTPVQYSSSPVHNGSPKVSFCHHDSITGILFSGKKCLSSSRSTLHLEIKDKLNVTRSIRRAYSETDMMRRIVRSPHSFPTRIVEEDEDLVDEDGRAGAVMAVMNRTADLEDLGVSGGGRGNGSKAGDGNGGGGGGGGNGDGMSGGGPNGDESQIGAYYQEMLKANPGNPLLLRNYGKFLHEVEGDVVKAEEYYSRAILASPGDGEVLSLYGKLIWEAHRDGSRARTYFDQAVEASPNDCYVLGSYAHFLWDAEEDEEEEESTVQELASAPRSPSSSAAAATALVEAC